MYHISDINKALVWGQNNPTSTLDDYLEYESKVITQKELNLLKDFTYDKVKLELNSVEYEFLVFANHSTYMNLEKLPNRLAGNRKHYLLTPMPGCWYDGIVVLHIPKKEQPPFFTISDWPEFGENKGLHIIGNEKLQFSFIISLNEDVEGDIFIKNRDIVDDYLTNYIKLWDNHSELHGYVNIELLNFKPIDDLFKILN